MFKVKIGLAAAGVVLALVVFVYLVTVLPLASQATKEVQNAVERANRLVIRSQRLQAFDLLTLAENIAQRPDFVKAVQVAEEKDRRIAVFDSITEFDKQLKKQGRKAHFFAVVDRQGQVIARDLDPNNMYGERLSYKNVTQALEGKAAKDVWGMKGRLMRAAAAPIRAGTEVVGAVAVAYEMTAADARDERGQFGTHVAYFKDDAIRASSFSVEGEEATEDSAMVESLSRQILGSPDAPAKRALSEDKPSDAFHVTLKGEEFLGIAGPLPVRLTNANVGYVVLSSLTKAQEPVTRVRWMFLVLGLAMLILVLAGMWIVAQHFVNAEDKLELGVAEVISGNMEYTFEANQEFEGLANALNVMLARLLGRPEPGEEGEEGEAAWRADVLFVEELDHVASGSDLEQQLAAEPEESYYARIFNEYLAARQRFNLPVEGITRENLTQKLKANEALLKAKHKCRMVRFVINTQGGKVSLKPIPIS